MERWRRMRATACGCTPSRREHRACDSYRRWADDVELVAELGLNAFRFSVSWARIVPGGRGRVESRGLDHYERLVDALLTRGVTPVLTLNHWDMPEALMDGRIADVGHVIDVAQLRQNMQADLARGHLPPACFQLVNNVVHRFFQHEKTDRSLLASLGHTAHQLASIERLVRTVALDDAQVAPLNLLISGIAISTFEAFTAATNAQTLARLARIDHFIIPRSALGTTHSVEPTSNTLAIAPSTLSPRLPRPPGCRRIPDRTERSLSVPHPIAVEAVRGVAASPESLRLSRRDVHPQHLYQKSPPIGELLDDLRCRLTGTVSCFRLDADEHGPAATLRSLQCRGKLEAVRGDYATVMIGCCDWRRKITAACLDVVQRRIGVKKWKIIRLIGAAVVICPSPADGGNGCRRTGCHPSTHDAPENLTHLSSSSRTFHVCQSDPKQPDHKPSTWHLARRRGR